MNYTPNDVDYYPLPEEITDSLEQDGVRSSKNFCIPIQKRWSRYYNDLKEIHHKLKNNEKIDQLDSADRIRMCNDRKLAMNPSLRTDVFLNKLNKLRMDFSNRTDQDVRKGIVSLVFESIQGETNDMISIEFLEQGVNAAKSVGKISGIEVGTGFLIGEGLLITNHHVIKDKESAVDYRFLLDYEDNFIGTPKAAQEFEFDPDSFFISNPGLDFTVIAVTPFSDNNVPLINYGFLPLLKQQGKIKMGDPVNIIHHPGGEPKKVTFRNNRLLYIKDNENANSNSESAGNYCLYEADTKYGSSGSAVFNDQWEVVALHHAGAAISLSGESLEVLEENKLTEATLKANEGIRISKIVKAIEDHIFDGEQLHMKEKRDALLKLWKQNKPAVLESATQNVISPTRKEIINSNGLKITIDVN